MRVKEEEEVQEDLWEEWKRFIVNQPIPTTPLSIVLFFSFVLHGVDKDERKKKKGEEMKEREIARMVKTYCSHVVA